MLLARINHPFAAGNSSTQLVAAELLKPCLAAAASAASAAQVRIHAIDPIVGRSQHPHALREFSHSGRLQDGATHGTSAGALSRSPRQVSRVAQLASSQLFVHAGHSSGSAARNSVHGAGKAHALPLRRSGMTLCTQLVR